MNHLPPLRTREQALAWLAGRVNYERLPPAPREFRLDRMRRLLACLGDPHERLPAVHIAGTKGKGSTASMVAGVLSAAGRRTGLFTSPHVHRFEERMTVDSRMPTGSELVALVNAVAGPAQTLDACGPEWAPTYFELATAMGWLFFEQQRCELAVLEVGLGGRLDATNLCRPLATAITNISHDHTDVLGRTLAEIAGEKAGIIKPGVPLVSGVRSGAARNVILARAREHAVELHEIGRDVHYRVESRRGSSGSKFQSDAPESRVPARGASADRPAELNFEPPDPSHGQRLDIVTFGRSLADVHLPLAGAHQAANAALAVALVDLVARSGRPVADAAVRAGLAGVSIPVRIECFPGRLGQAGQAGRGGWPAVVIDAAHNLASVAALVATLGESFPRRGRRVLIFAVSRDKDARGMLRRLLPEFDEAVLTRYTSNDRGLPVEALAALARGPARTGAAQQCRVHVADDPAAAWQMGLKLAGPDDLVCVTGSFYLAAELRERLLAERHAGQAFQPDGGHV